MRSRPFAAFHACPALAPPGTFPLAPHPLASALANVPAIPDALAFVRGFAEAHAKRTGVTLRAACEDLVRHAPEHMRERLRRAAKELIA